LSYLARLGFCVLVLLSVLAAVGASSAQAATYNGAFYYPWYPQTWTVEGQHVSNFYHPTLGFYSSDDQAIADQHVKWLADAGFNFGIASYWTNPAPNYDQYGRIGKLLTAASQQRPGFKWALNYEREGSGNPTIAQIQYDMYEIRSIASHPNYFRPRTLDGFKRPALFIYNADDTTCAVVDKWKQAVTDFALIMKVFDGYQSCPIQPHGWYQYGPDKPTGIHRFAPYSDTISPGMRRADDADPPGGSDCFAGQNQTCPYLARDPARWQSNVQECVNANNLFCLVTTFNEWGEGTAIEAAQEWCSPPCTWGDYMQTFWRTATPVCHDLIDNDGDGKTDFPADPGCTSVLDTDEADPVTVDATLAADGDISPVCEAGSPPATAASTANLVASMNPTNVLTLGDNQYNSGALADFINCYNPTWGQHLPITKPSPGNHDNCPATSYDEYFASRLPGSPASPCYYSFNIGNWHIISLSSGSGDRTVNGFTSTQLAWLDSDLAAEATNPHACLMAYWHHPLYDSSASHGTDDNSGARPVWQRLLARHADLILNGHAHTYERFAKQNDVAQADPNGIREIISGLGGADRNQQLANADPNSQVRYGTNTTPPSDYGALKLTLKSNGYDWQFTTVNNVNLDASSDTCNAK
jgi:calcineurin-like phosphoesterase family protein